MNKWRGFTIVEIVIVMTIMAILLALATLTLTRNQANVRDTERKADVENIARGLEIRYKEGNPVVTTVNSSDPSAITGPGTYPSINEWLHMTGKTQSTWTPSTVSEGYGPKNLPGTTINSFTAPNTTGDYAGIEPICTSSCDRAAGVTTDITAVFNTDAKKNKYYYEPVDATGKVCTTGPCVRFALYYWRETKGSYETVVSTHQ